MKDIWGFLLQTVNISTIAAVILILKALLKDKLPPRWQYHVWYLLAVCMIAPAGGVGGVLIPWLHILVQSAKTAVESGMLSAFSSPAAAIYNTLPFPVISGTPASITDWLMVIYTAGIMLAVMRYVVNYIRLGIIVSQAQPADGSISACVAAVAEKYGLKSCPAVTIDTVSSAFVTGLKNPVLVLPQDKETDEKVILHELLHLHHHDLWQNMLWALLFTLHWPNPFMCYVLSVIHNDMEALCDQRVLELLEGEERREYGRILLSMANDSYPSAFGTTSISNGGRFIAQRIESIARFRKYPAGMGLVSVCMAVVLLPPLIAGNGVTYPANAQWQGNEFTAMDMAQSILVKHTSPYAAVDTYIKGLRRNNHLYQLSVMPQENLTDYKNHIIDADSRIFTGNTNMFSYYILNMAQQTDDMYTADIAIINERKAQSVQEDKFGVLHYEDGTVKQLFEVDGEISEEQQLMISREMAARYADITIIPVKIIREYGWKIQPSGDIQHTEKHRYEYNSDLSLAQLEGIYPRKTVQADLSGGSFTAEILPVTAVISDTSVATTAVGINQWYSVKISYTFAEGAQPEQTAGMLMDDMSAPAAKSDLNHLINDEIWNSDKNVLYSYNGTDYGSRLICHASQLVDNNMTVYHTNYENYRGENLSLTRGTGLGIAVIADGAKAGEIILDLQAGEIYETK